MSENPNDEKGSVSGTDGDGDGDAMNDGGSGRGQPRYHDTAMKNLH